MKFLIIILMIPLLLQAEGCKKKKKKPQTVSTVSTTPTPTPTPTPPVDNAGGIPTSLIATWTVCVPVEFTSSSSADLPIQSATVDLTFENSGTGNKKQTYNSDAFCQKPLTQADADAYINQMKAKLGGPVANEDEIRAKFPTEPTVEKFDFAVPRNIGNGDYELDITVDKVTAYHTITIVGDSLKLSLNCSENDYSSGACPKITGETADTRSAIDTRAPIFRKKD